MYRTAGSPLKRAKGRYRNEHRHSNRTCNRRHCRRRHDWCRPRNRGRERNDLGLHRCIPHGRHARGDQDDEQPPPTDRLTTAGTSNEKRRDQLWSRPFFFKHHRELIPDSVFPALAATCGFNSGNIDFLHGHHRVERTFGFGTTGS